MTASKDTPAEKQPEGTVQKSDVAPMGWSPKFMYVHYMEDEHSSPYPVHLFQISGFFTERKIEEAIEAIWNRHTAVERGHNGVEWNVYSYIVFVLNDATQRLTDIELKHRDTGENYSFELVGYHTYKNCSIVYFINTRKNRHSNPLAPGEAEVYDWFAHHAPTFAPAPGADSDPADRRTHDDSGTNVGP